MYLVWDFFCKLMISSTTRALFVCIDMKFGRKIEIILLHFELKGGPHTPKREVQTGCGHVGYMKVFD